MIRALVPGGAFAAASMIAAAASAQSGVAEVCANMPTPAEEIACLRGALEESRAGRTPVRDPAPTRPPETARRQQPDSAPARELGREQVAATRAVERAEKAERSGLRAVATPVGFDHLGLVTLRLDNGQLWQQAEARAIPLRLRENQSYPVEIQASGFGGYRMHFTQMNREIVVRRKK